MRGSIIDCLWGILTVIVNPLGAQVASYAFTFQDEEKNDTQIRVMLPLLDLLNHANQGLSSSPASVLRISLQLTAMQHMSAHSHLSRQGSNETHDRTLPLLDVLNHANEAAPPVVVASYCSHSAHGP